jgi:thymidylate synthase
VIVHHINESYADLLTELVKAPIETNARTGVRIRAIPGGTSFKVDLDRLPVAGNRKMFPHVAAAEVAWQFMGTKDPAFILKKAPKLWQHFVEDGELKTAYGYRWRSHFDRDQLALAIKQLANNPTNRQLYISAWDPAMDGLGEPNQPKNIPCPVGFSLTAFEGKLHCSMFLRSSDAFVGLPYDVMAYSLTVDAIAQSAGLEPGTLHVTMAHAHLYEPHWQMAQDCLRESGWDWYGGELPRMPMWDVDMILRQPDVYVDRVKALSTGKVRSDYAPLPDLVL